MVIAEKENFLIRVLMKKLSERKIASEFVPWQIDLINRHFEGCALITPYIDEGRRPPEKPFRFLVDKMTDEGRQMIPIGGEEELEYLKTQISSDLIYSTFTRPVDNEAYADTVAELLDKVKAGEFKKTILIVDDDVSFLRNC